MSGLHKSLGSNSPVTVSSLHELLAREREGRLLKQRGIVGRSFDENWSKGKQSDTLGEMRNHTDHGFLAV